jgi:hypothetical protein
MVMPKHQPVDIAPAPDHVEPSQLPVEHLAPAQTNKELELQLTQRYMTNQAEMNRQKVGPVPIEDMPHRMPLIERRAPAPKPELNLHVDDLVERAKERAESRKKLMNKAVKETDAATIQAAQLILRKFCALSSDWAQKIEAVRLERHLSDDQICLSFLAYAVDSGQHMQIPSDHPYFSEHFDPAGTDYICIMCDKEGKRAYPGQPPVHIISDERCSMRFNQLTVEQKKELIEAAA